MLFVTVFAGVDAGSDGTVKTQEGIREFGYPYWIRVWRNHLHSNMVRFKVVLSLAILAIAQYTVICIGVSPILNMLSLFIM